jgi:small-conductance mechanosensitive channel
MLPVGCLCCRRSRSAPRCSRPDERGGGAFALQDVILSVAGWVAIHWLSIYHPGDRIEILGVKGDIIDINVLQTTIMEIGGWVNADLYNGRIVRLGNNYIFKGPVINYTADFPFLWDEIVLPIKFTSDHDQARSLMLQIADEIVGDYARESEERWADVVRKYLDRAHSQGRLQRQLHALQAALHRRLPPAPLNRRPLDRSHHRGAPGLMGCRRAGLGDHPAGRLSAHRRATPPVELRRRP